MLDERTPADVAADLEAERRAQAAMRGLHAAVRQMARNNAIRGAALRACVEAGWLITDLALELGVGRGTIYRWMAVTDADAE